MGDAESRPGLRRRAARALRSTHGAALGDEFRERVEANPLRVLDSKVDDWQDVIERAPQLTEYLSDDVGARTSSRCRPACDALGIAFELAPRLVRGFDYYTGTTFEFQSDALDAAQNAIGGGGRYDGLAEEMGGPPTPGHRLRDRASSGSLLALRRRGRVPARRGARRRVRRRRARRRAAARRSAVLVERAARREGFARRPRVRRPVGEGAVEGGRPVGRARSA